MNELIKNWNFKKHFIAVTGFYATIKAVGTFLFMRKHYKKTISEKSFQRLSKNRQKTELGRAMSVGYLEDLSKPQKVFYGGIALCYLVDLSSYLLVKGMKKKL